MIFCRGCTGRVSLPPDNLAIGPGFRRREFRRKRTRMVRRHPPAVKPGAPGTAPCRNGPLSQTLNSVPRRLFFLLSRSRDAASIRFGAAIKLRGATIADRFPEPFQPEARPCELDAENREPDRDDDDGRSRRDEHDEANQQHRCPDQRHDDAPGCPVCQMYDLPDHSLFQTRLISLDLTVAFAA